MQNQYSLQQAPLETSYTLEQQLGSLTLHSLAGEKPANNSHFNNMVCDDILPTMASSSTSSSTLVGDYIGVESCLDLKDNGADDDGLTSPSTSRKEERSSDDGDDDYDHQSFCSRHQQRWSHKWERKNKEFPPPIPWLARTENLPSHMPWVLRRYHTSDGRLILREEKVRHHEYFRAHRSNGRLTLQIVALDSHQLGPPPPPVIDEEGQEEEEEDEEEEVGVGVEQKEGIIKDSNKGNKMQITTEDDINIESSVLQGHGEREGDDEYEADDGATVNGDNDEVGRSDQRGVEEEKVVYEDQQILPPMEAGIGGGASAGKYCFSFNSVRPTSACIFGMPPMPALRPVHS
ncbi:hypothetical protein Tsubulata_008563 [Turnera subulata]|uniref:FAF domain-containing protein n=1 Tax=Turnera subulata TaxID=218843 RepID=A0A9Q0FXW7_9ROSI|nr:hypothetical protein Tsubulata_008563 [Turnera subulata]